MKDGHGLHANDRAKMEQKKRQRCRVEHLAAHTPDQLSVESDDSGSIASCPTSVPKGLTGSGSAQPSPRAGDAARARRRRRWSDQAQCTNTPSARCHVRHFRGGRWAPRFRFGVQMPSREKEVLAIDQAYRGAFWD